MKTTKNVEYRVHFYPEPQIEKCYDDRKDNASYLLFYALEDAQKAFPKATYTVDSQIILDGDFAMHSKEGNYAIGEALSYVKAYVASQKVRDLAHYKIVNELNETLQSISIHHKELKDSNNEIIEIVCSYLNQWFKEMLLRIRIEPCDISL